MQPVEKMVSDQLIDLVYGDSGNYAYFYEGIESSSKSTIQEKDTLGIENISVDNEYIDITDCPSCRSSKLSWKGNWKCCTCCGEVIAKKERLLNIFVEEESKLGDEIAHSDALKKTDLSDIRLIVSPTKLDKIKHKFYAVFAA